MADRIVQFRLGQRGEVFDLYPHPFGEIRRLADAVDFRQPVELIRCALEENASVCFGFDPR